MSDKEKLSFCLVATPSADSTGSESTMTSLQPDIQSEPMREVLALIDEICRHPWSAGFREPVDCSIVPSYPQVIKNPMDFATILKKVDNNEYCTVHELVGDVQLIFSNCKVFNEEDSDIWINAACLGKLFRKKYAKIRKKYLLPGKHNDEPTPKVVNLFESQDAPPTFTPSAAALPAAVLENFSCGMICILLVSEFMQEVQRPAPTPALIALFRVALRVLSVVAALHLAKLIHCLYNAASFGILLHCLSSFAGLRLADLILCLCYAELDSACANLHVLVETVEMGRELLHDLLGASWTMATISVWLIFQACFFLRDAAGTMAVISAWVMFQAYFFLRDAAGTMATISAWVMFQAFFFLRDAAGTMATIWLKD